MQFRLRTLFTTTAVVALLLGLWRILGTRLGLVLVIGIELAIPFLWRPRWLYSWFLPLLWTTIAWNNYYHPGDEYAGFFSGGSLAGLWIIAIIGDAGAVHHTAVLVVATGAGTVAVAGWLLDKLRAPLIPWAFLFLLSAAGIFQRSFGSFPTVERALAKNGSYEAYILPSLNLGLIFATLVMLAATALHRLSRRFRPCDGTERPASPTTSGK
jgi:hypothetical protein